MRWHPLIVKWCLYQHYLSNGAYETLRNSGVIQLPSTRTLRDYKHFSPARVGFSVHSDRQLLDLMTVKGNLAKYCVILIDEMYVKEGLTFDKATGALIGLTDFGEVTNKIMELEQHLKCGLSRPVAKTVLTFMVKGLFTDISFPYAYFPVTDVKGQDIFPLLWDTVERLTRLGIIVLGVTCDGAKPNRRMIQLHQQADKSNPTIHKAINFFSTEQRDFLFFIDPPHLIKQSEIVSQTLID